MHESRRRPKLLLALLIALLAYAAVRSRDRTALAPEVALRGLLEVPLVALSSASAYVSNGVREVLRREHLRDQIHELEARVAELHLELSEMSDVRRENERLTELLELRSRTRCEARAGRVIGGASSGLRSLVVDVGERNGVVADAAVVAKEGLVGRVLKVGAVTSVVQLITDSTSGVAVIIERSRVPGVLTGRGADACRLRYVANLEDVKVGDRVLASGLDGIYPKGVEVGTVTEVEAGPDTFQSIRVTPAVAMARLETVLILGDRRAEPLPDAPGPLAELRPEPPAPVR